jgi:hypothetical protein
MKPEEAMDILREAHREPIPEAHFAAVRARVLSQIAAERGASRRRLWSWGLAVVSATALLLAFWPKPVVPRRVAREITAGVEKPLADPRGSVSNGSHEPAVAGVRPRARRRLPVTGVIGPPNPAPLVVKLLTNDPNVVIYWISERTGE